MNEIRSRPTLRSWCIEHQEMFIKVYAFNRKRPVYIGNGYMALFLRIFYLDYDIACIEFVEDEIIISLEEN